MILPHCAGQDHARLDSGGLTWKTAQNPRTNRLQMP